MVRPVSGTLCVIVFWAWKLSFLPGAVSHLWSCLIFQSKFPQHHFFMEADNPVVASCPGGGNGCQTDVPDTPGPSPWSSPLLCFYPFCTSRKLSIGLHLCLLDYSVHFYTSPTYFLLSKDSSLLLDPLRASPLGLGPHFELIFFLLYFSYNF